MYMGTLSGYLSSLLYLLRCKALGVSEKCTYRGNLQENVLHKLIDIAV